MVARTILLFLIISLPQVLFCQYLRAEDIDTTGKDKEELCKEIDIKYNNLLKKSPIPENSTIFYGNTFPKFIKTNKERKKGFFIYNDSLNLLPDSIFYYDVYVRFRVDPYGEVICFNILKIIGGSDWGVDMLVLQRELQNKINKRVKKPGYASFEKIDPIYFPYIVQKIRVQRLQ